MHVTKLNVGEKSKHPNILTSVAQTMTKTLFILLAFAKLLSQKLGFEA